MSGPRRTRAVPPCRPEAVIEELSPVVDGGRFPAKAVAGDPVIVSALVFAHGHSLVRAFVRYRDGAAARWTRTTMTALGNDHFAAVVIPGRPGTTEVEVLGEVDHLATWRRDAGRRVGAGVFDPHDPLIGTALLKDAARRLVPPRRAKPLGAAPTGEDALTAAAADSAAHTTRRVTDGILVGPGTRVAAGRGWGTGGTSDPGPAVLVPLAPPTERELQDTAAAVKLIVAQLRKVTTAAGLGAVLAELELLEEMLDARPPDSSEPIRARLELAVQRELGACASWYECFPRSASPDESRPGTLKDLIGRLDYIADLGFDICYLPPIHPIGATNRKGRNNVVGSTPADVGSPWAIGGPAGGHDSVAPELGTIEEFDQLVAEAGARGLEIALDLAFQCSPDHPWVREHPDWFAHRLDGTIACAENPPKRYQDVYPLDFSTPDREGLFKALLGVVRFWRSHGVRVFRVDNPHTKPFELWEWLIAAAREEDPGVVFLSEAFTRPAVMRRLAKLGFDQSYTYFTWRDSKAELTEYLEELAHGPGADYFRGSLWPNTPDILARSLQHGGRPSFVARLVLAACGSASYGIYGPVFELMEDRPAAPGSEEYLGSEKYEVRHFALEPEPPLAPVIRRLNTARRVHPALRRDDGLCFHRVDNDQLICWSKRDERRDDTVLCVVSLDPVWTQSGFVELDLAALGLAEDQPFVVHDLLADATYTWRGSRNFVLLDPARDNVHVFEVEPSPAPEADQ